MSKFVTNGKIIEVIESGSLMEAVYGYGGMGPASEPLDGRCVPFEKGVISYYGVHVFSKCNDNKCKTCETYKNIPRIKVIYKQNTTNEL